MRLSLIIVSSALALGLLAAGDVMADKTARPPLATRTPDADTEARLAKARSKTSTGDAEDFLDGLDVWEKLAEQGVPEAQLTLGRFYQYGHIPALCPDEAQAAEWYSKAADQGVAEAMRRLGDVYGFRFSRLFDPVKAAAWYQKGASFDDMESEAQLSGLYYRGIGVPKDPTKSLYWLEKAANHPEGILQALLLGDRYREGRDYPVRDDEKAIYWYLRAANGGEGDAQSRVAAIYEERGNYVEAYRWYAMAVKLENKTAESKPYLQDDLLTGNKDRVSVASEQIREEILAMDRVAAKVTREERAKADKWVNQTQMTPVWAVPIMLAGDNERYCKPQILLPK